jgi:GntR family transcriptional regulator
MKPMFRRIADDLRERIVSGDLRVGDQLPTLESLMAEYKTTTVTVRRALDDLTREGLTASRPTVGTFVRDLTRHRLELSDGSGIHGLADRLLVALAGTGEPRIESVRTELVYPQEGIRNRLLTADQRALLRYRVVAAGPARIGIIRDYFPADLQIAEIAGSPDRADLDAFDLLAEAGVVPDRVTEELFTRMPTPDETQEIGWPTGMPALVEMRTVFLPSGDPVACLVKVMAGDRWIAVEHRPYPAAEARIRAVG